MPGLAWLIAQPFAHRGLHDATAGVIENTFSAFAAAIAANYGIECDLQISGDGEAMVYHDDALGRLTEGHGRLAEMSAADIKKARFKATSDRILRLSELCEMVGGRTPLLLELKSHYDNDRRLAQRATDVLANYPGPVALMSFDPAVVEVARWIAPHLTRGIVAERHYAVHEWNRFSPAEKRRMAFLLHAKRTRPHFIAYGMKDLPALAPLIAHTVFQLPLLTWTVRSKADQARAMRWADQFIFEGIRP